MNYWITTDTHFNHKKLIELGRPENFEELIKKNLKQTIKEGDYLIHLGDICIGNDIENSNWFKNELGCKTILCRGNHDSKSIEWYLNNGWDIVVDKFSFKLFGKNICFSHKPQGWDGCFDVNLHGHLHDCNHRFEEVNGHNRLIALEQTKYKPFNLKNI